MDEFIKKIPEKMGNQQSETSHRSFSLVDHKVAEAEFFLVKLGDSGFDCRTLRDRGEYQRGRQTRRVHVRTSVSGFPRLRNDVWMALK